MHGKHPERKFPRNGITYLGRRNHSAKGKDLVKRRTLDSFVIISSLLTKHHLCETEKILKRKKARHNIMELEGLGAHIWKDIEALEYVGREKES